MSWVDGCELFTDEDERNHVDQFIKASQLILNFENSTLDEAYRSALARGKRLAVYLQEVKPDRINMSTLILKDYEVRNELNSRFVLFPWDCSTRARRKHIQTRINEVILSGPEQTSSFWLNPSSLPCLVLISSDNPSNPCLIDLISLRNRFDVLEKLNPTS